MASNVHPPLLPDPTCLHLSHLEASPRRITAVVSATALKALCAAGGRSALDGLGGQA